MIFLACIHIHTHTQMYIILHGIHSRSGPVCSIMSCPFCTFICSQRLAQNQVQTVSKCDCLTLSSFFLPSSVAFFTSLSFAHDFCCYISVPAEIIEYLPVCIVEQQCQVPSKKLPVSFNTCLPPNCCAQILFVVLSITIYKH